MGDVDASWKEVGNKFTELGYRFRDHYRKLEEERATGEEAAGEEAEEEVKKAFAKVSEELDTAFSSVGNAFRDAEVREDAKAAANSLVSALGATFAEIGDALQRAFGRKEAEAPEPFEPGEAAQPEPPETEGEPPAEA